MKKKYGFVFIMLLVITLVCTGVIALGMGDEKIAEENTDLTIVTSFYPMYVATLNVVDGVEGIQLKNLSEPQTGCLHDFQLTTADMKLLSTADVLIVNGGGIESFIEDVAKEYPNLQIVEACENVELICNEGDTHEHEEVDEHEHEAEGEHEEEHEEEHEHEHNHAENAHAWMSVKDYRAQVETIAGKLAELDEQHAEKYFKNAESYDAQLAELQEMQEEIKEMTNDCPVISFHSAFAYIAQDLDFHVACLLDLDEADAISAGDKANVYTTIEEDGVCLVLAEKDSSEADDIVTLAESMGQEIESETSAHVVYIDTLNRGNYEKDSYIIGMRANLEALQEALEESSGCVHEHHYE